MVRRSRRVNSGTLSLPFGGASETGAESFAGGGGAWLGAASPAEVPTGGADVATDTDEVTKFRMASDSTVAGFLPVAAAAPVPAAPPATVPIAAPLPPPAIAPMTAPKAAPPPILVTLLLECDSPLITIG